MRFFNTCQSLVKLEKVKNSLQALKIHKCLADRAGIDLFPAPAQSPADESSYLLSIVQAELLEET